VFSGRGPAILPEARIDQHVHLGWLNSTIIRRLVEVQSNKQEYMTGTIKSLPWVELGDEANERLRGLVEAVHASWAAAESSNELSFLFLCPVLRSESAGSRQSAWTGRPSPAEQAELDAVINQAYGIKDDDIIELVELLADEEEPPSEQEDEDDRPTEIRAGDAQAAISWAVGLAFGRFDVRLATGASESPGPPDPFGDLPIAAPSVLAGEDIDRVVPSDYPLAIPPDGVLVDDEGHPRDIVDAIRSVYDCVYANEAEEAWQHAIYELDPRRGDVRGWVAGRFFAEHLKRYSRNRRKAPLYWQLTTPSGRYSVWLYAHRLSDDSLFQVQNDILAPKLAYEERQLASLVEEATDSPSAKQRREIEAQEVFVEELRVLLEDLRRVAPLWRATLDDGIVLVMAPLWRLVAHKSWQRELKKKWLDLVAGHHDWALLAMHLWPERVVPKCAEDRSLAIAHGLEDVFWFEDEDGKWRPRDEPTESVDDIIRERASGAVKDALGVIA
jgi:hypothetical protein